MRRILPALRALAQISGAALLLLVALELAATAVVTLRDGGYLGDAGLDVRARTELYRDEPWTAEYFREFHQLRELQWEPYVYWRRRPFEGRWIQVDEKTHRRTWAPPPPAPGAPRHPVVWFLGGSTTWGSGVRDDYTIPSQVSRLMAEAGTPIDAVNLAESGWVATQERIYLMRLLQRGERPDWVVFYDGFNDVYASYQHGRTGASHNEFHRDFELGLATGVGPARGVAALARNLSLVRLAKGVLRRLGPPRWPGPGDEAERERRLQEMVQVFEGNRRQVRALAAEYDFRVQTYLQPHIYAKPRRTDHEARVVAQDPAMAAFYEEAYARLRAGAAPGDERCHFRDISDLFVDEPQAIFADFCHCGEAATTRIAERMAADLLARLRAEP